MIVFARPAKTSARMGGLQMQMVRIKASQHGRSRTHQVMERAIPYGEEGDLIRQMTLLEINL